MSPHSAALGAMSLHLRWHHEARAAIERRVLEAAFWGS